jgi:hypothetical protein
MIKIQNPKPVALSKKEHSSVLVIEYWNLIFICILKLVIWNLIIVHSGYSSNQQS